MRLLDVPPHSNRRDFELACSLEVGRSSKPKLLERQDPAATVTIDWLVGWLDGRLMINIHRFATSTVLVIRYKMDVHTQGMRSSLSRKS